jgi:aryl-alcohol dehydrogenase-like predicted oxidoreductase
MNHVNLGASGLKVSRLCLGCMTYGDPAWRGWKWVRNEEESRPFIREALEAGITFFDTADFYSQGASERIVGKALADFARRDEVVIATKVCMPMGDGPNQRGLSRKHIMESIDASLARLGTDYVDLYQIHRWDYDTPVEETLAGLDDVVRAGKALYLGASSMHAWQFMKALGIQRAEGFAPFVSMQDFYNLLYREEEREMLPLCRSEGIGVIPWSPLARGFLTGNRSRGGNGVETTTARGEVDDNARTYFGTDQDFAIIDRVKELAARLGRTPAQVALAWVAGQPGITAPVIGASKEHHIAEAVAALGLVLDEADRAWLEEPYRPRAVQGHE